MHRVLEGVVKNFFRYWFDLLQSQITHLEKLNADKDVKIRDLEQKVADLNRNLVSQSSTINNNFKDQLLKLSIDILSSFGGEEHLESVKLNINMNDDGPKMVSFNQLLFF